MILFVGIQLPTKNAIAEGTFPFFPNGVFHLPIVVGHPFFRIFGSRVQQTACIRQITAATAPIPIQNTGSTFIRFIMAIAPFGNNRLSFVVRRFGRNPLSAGSLKGNAALRQLTHHQPCGWSPALEKGGYTLGLMPIAFCGYKGIRPAYPLSALCKRTVPRP